MRNVKNLQGKVHSFNLSLRVTDMIC